MSLPVAVLSTSMGSSLYGRKGVVQREMGLKKKCMFFQKQRVVFVSNRRAGWWVERAGWSGERWDGFPKTVF